MRNFNEYYDPQVSMKESVGALSDPSLDHEKNRDDVNKLLMNLVMRYVAEYLKAPASDIAAIKRKAEAAVQNTEADVMQMLMDVMAKQMGMPQAAQYSKTDKLAVESLVDLRATAAIMKEIIFGGEFKVDQRRGGIFDNTFIGMDLGSGTGILTLAMAIAARRTEIANVTVIGLDISPVAVENSQRVLSRVLPSEQFLMKRGNIADPMCWAIVHDMPLHYLVSETIGPSTPPIEKRNGGWAMRGEERKLRASMLTQMDMDPFPVVFMNAMQYRPQLERDIHQGRTAMFPDLIGGRYSPHYEYSTLALKTASNSTHRKLNKAGDEFSDFEEFDIQMHRRWQGGKIEL